MVKIRVTVTVVPENVYFAAQSAPLNSAVRSAPARKLPVACESPETWTIGQFVNKIKDAYTKTYRGEDLGVIKYIKDEDDADLHTDLSVYDALVDAGREAMDRSDQRSKITIIQEQGLPLRGGSIMPDLLAPKYQYPRPPPPPLFSQPQSNARKRSMDAAFGEDGSSAHWPSTRPIHRPRLDTTNVEYTEDAPFKSVELDTLEDEQVPGRRQEAIVDLTQDVQMSILREAASVDHGTADHRSLADAEPKSESPNPQAAFQQLKPNSISSLEVLESAATATQNVLESNSLTWSDEQGEGRPRRRDNRAPKQSSRDYTPLLSVGNHSAGRRAAVLKEVSVSEVMQPRPAANTLLRKQLQLQTLHNRPNAPITPPSDASPADVRGKLSHSTPKSGTSMKATSISSMFKPTMPRQDTFEPPSSIEDSQMSPQSKRRSTSHTNREANLAKTMRYGSRTISEGGKATIPFIEAAQLYDRSTPIMSGKRARNEPVYNRGEDLSVLGDEDDYQRQSRRGNVHDVLEPSAAVQDTLDEEESTEHSMADSRERNEDLSEVSNKTESLKDSHKSASFSREPSGSIGHAENESTKEYNINGGIRRPQGSQAQEQTVDAEMEDAFSENEITRSDSGSQRLNERFQDVKMLTERTEPPPGPKSKDQTTIDILNGGGLFKSDFEVSGNAGNENKPGGSLRTAGTRSTEVQDEVSIGTESRPDLRKRRKKKKKSDIEGSTPRLETAAGLLEFDMDKDDLAEIGADGPHAVFDVVQHKLSRTKATSEVETPTSAGSAGNQLQESLQESTKEGIQSTKAATTSRHKFRPSEPSTSQVDSCLSRNKVYNGIVRANEGVSALIELQGVKGNPCGLLHRNALPQGPFKGLIATKLSLGQVVKVKVRAGSKTKGSEALVKLTMFGIDQTLGDCIPPPLDEPLLDEPQKQQSGPREDHRHLGPEQGSPSNASNSQHATSSLIRLSPSQAKETTSNNVSADAVIERREQQMKELESVDTDDKTGSEVEIIHAGVRPSTPENNGQPEPRFGLGFTNTPRKRKQGAASGEEVDSTKVARFAQTTPSRKGMSAGNENAPLGDAHRSKHNKTKKTTSSNAAATRNPSPQPKKASKKTKAKSELPDKPTTLQRSAEIVRPQARQGMNLKQKDTKVSRSESESDALEQGSLPTKLLQTDRMNVEQQENLAFPKTMSKDQYLALRKANADAIARRDASAAEKDGVATPSGTAKAHPGIKAAKSTAKKQKAKLIGEHSLPAGLEIPPPAAETIRGKIFKDKRSSVERAIHAGGLETATSDHKYTKSDRGGIDGQEGEDGKILLREDGTLASAERSALDSKATPSPTPSRSASPAPAQAINTVPPTVPVESSSKPKAQITNPKPQRVKLIPTNLTHAKTPLSSKALSLAELRAQKEAVKKSNKASSSSLSQFKSTATTSGPRTALTFGSDSDESGSESESGSSSEDMKKQRNDTSAVKRKAFQRVASKPDPTIRDRSMSVDVDDDDNDESD